MLYSDYQVHDMGHVLYVGFATRRHATVKIRLYFKRLMFMQMICKKINKKKRVITIIIQDDERGLIMQTMVRGQTIQIDPQLISTVIGVPVLSVSGVPFSPGVEAPSIDFLHDLFGTRPQREEKSHSHINIGAFAPMHRFLAKVVVTNLWPQTRRSELTLKKATLLYAIVMKTPFCLCKHILHTMLEKNTSLSFGCSITQIYLQVGTDISDSDPDHRFQILLAYRHS
jgi:hypothetical protein